MTVQVRTLSGSSGIWTFVFIDMLLFLAIFVIFVLERLRLPEIYASSQTMLSGWYGLVNTLVLLSSSWMMVRAVESMREREHRHTRFYLLLVIVCGLIFCGLKFSEYWFKYKAGLGPLQNSFFTFYYFMTALHLIHLIGGLVFINAIRSRLVAGSTDAPSTVTVENCGIFWHFVDTLWIYIFPLLYLIGLK